MYVIWTPWLLRSVRSRYIGTGLFSDLPRLSDCCWLYGKESVLASRPIFYGFAAYRRAVGYYRCKNLLCSFQMGRLSGQFRGVFKIWEGGIAIYGALIGSIIAAGILCAGKGYNFWRIADICAPSLIVGSNDWTLGQLCEPGSARRSSGGIVFKGNASSCRILSSTR